MIGLFTLLLPVGLAASQASIDLVYSCLKQQDTGCARRAVDEAGMADDSDPMVRTIAADVAFHEANYPLAYDLLSGAVAAGAADRYERLALYERSMYATAGWTEVERGRYRIRYRPGADAVLVEPAIEALERTDRFVTDLIGQPPPGSTVVELFPNGRSFVAASSLTKDDVSATGVVALSKWTRLLVTSPRALGRGYDWQSTLSHEYIHLVVATASYDKAPVWLQEAIAKYLDNRWETGDDGWRLSPTDQSNLARALAEDDLVPFEEMHPSLAKIKVLAADGTIDHAASAQRSQTAYAQLSSLMAFVFERQGEGVLREVMPEVAAGVDPRVALYKAGGFDSFQGMLTQWEGWIRQLDLIDAKLAQMPTVLDGGDESELDPVLAQRRDLANYVRLGDLLRERERYRAALIEYDKALPEDDTEPMSPMLASRLAQTHISMSDLRAARVVLEESLEVYPEVARSWSVKALLERRSGRPRDAVDALERAVALDPFSIDNQQRLLDLMRETSDPSAESQAAVVSILRRGGESGEVQLLHERYGEYELPRSPEAKPDRKAAADAFKGSEVPSFEVHTIQGEEIAIEDLRGRVVMLDFWATWCGPCKMILPKLSDMAERYEEDGLSVLSISDEAKSKVQRFLAMEAKRGIEYAQVMALESGAARRAFRVRSIPTLVVVDRAGIVQLVHVGAGDMSEIDKLVQDLLENTPAPLDGGLLEGLKKLGYVERPEIELKTED